MIALTIVALGLLGAEGTDEAFEQFFARYAEKRDNIQTFEANFTQKSVITGEPTVETTGDLVYIKPRRILLRTTDPETATLVDGETYYEYDGDFKQLVVTSLENEAVADIFFLAFENNTDKLRKNYTVYQIEGNNPRGKQGIEIKPKHEEGVTPPFEDLTIFLRDEDMLPYEVRIMFDQDSFVYFYIMDHKVNNDLPSECTQIALPEGTKIIEAGELKEEVGPGGKRYPDVIKPVEAE